MKMDRESYSKLTELDIKLKLLTGRSINAKNFGDIEPLTLKEIIDMNYSKYAESLNTILLGKKQLLNGEELDDFDEISDLELLIYMSDDRLIEMIEESYCNILKCKKAYVDKEELYISLDYSTENEEKFIRIDRNNYEEISKVIKLQNCIESVSDVGIENDESEEVRKFKEKLKQLDQERKKAKERRDGKSDEDSLDFYDIISSLTSKSANTNELDILDFTIYQVYEKFKKVQIIDKYEIDIKTMLAGAKNVDIKHWTSKS